MTLDDILNADYSPTETAGALEHPNFNDFRRNLARDDRAVLPRNATRGPGGPGYAYAHIFEMACYLPIASRYGHETASKFCHGLFRHLERQVFNTKEYQDESPLIRMRTEEFEEDKYNLGALVVAPGHFFHSDRISRDANNHTWAIFAPHRIRHDPDAVSTCNERDADGTVAGMAMIRDVVMKQVIVGLDPDDDRAHYTLGYEAVGPGLLDLTAIVLRFEKNLEHRLRARNLGRRS